MKILTLIPPVMMKQTINFWLVLLLVFSGLQIQAQDSKSIDSIIKVSTSEMYKNPDKTIKTGNEILKATNDVDVKIRAYKLISDGYSAKRDYQKSLEYVIKANELLPQTKDKRLKISVTTKTGIQYHQLKIFDKAIENLDKAEKLCLEYDKPDSVHVSLAVNYVVRGFIYKEKLNCGIAIEFFDRGVQEIMKSKDVVGNSNVISIAKYNKGNCYLLMSDTKLAKQSFEESLQYAKNIKAASLLGFAEKGLAQVYTMEGDYNQAISLLHEALTTSKEVDDLILNQEIYRGLSENYLAINKWDEYRKYHQKYLDIQNEVKVRERKSAGNSLEAIKVEFAEKYKNEVPGILYKTLIVAVILIVLTAFLLLSSRKRKVTILKLEASIKNLQGEKMLKDYNKT
ncbi:hypothetical protein [Flavobacterium sp.]|uniref:tetratricopeptide repeat protein n=1 Tax=Flavobacterium sp. TaxID=239 RepID=UPI0028BED816|nr:hypothetical protein [Flavobacterium sp.]